MRLKKYYFLGRMFFLEKYASVWDSAVAGLLIAVILFIFLNVWTTLYGSNASFEGFSLTQIIWYLALTELIILSTGLERIETLGEEIRSGEIANALLKPLNFVGKEVSSLYSNFIYKFLLIGAIAFTTAYILVGVIPFSLVSLIPILVVIFFAVTISLLLMIGIALLALWLEDVYALSWIYQKSLYILGGMILPLDFYPTWLKGILLHLPPSYMVYLPSKLFVHFSWSKFGEIVFGQLCWLAVSLVGVLLVYRWGVRKVSVYGG